MLPKILANTNWVSTVMKTFILSVVAKAPVKGNTFAPKDTIQRPTDRTDPAMAKPTEPRLRSPRIRTQDCKAANQGGGRRDARVCRGNPPQSPAQHAAARQPATSRLTARPARRHPRVGREKPEPCSRGISRLAQTRGKGASPAGKPGTHVRGRGEEAGPAQGGGAS